jgi:general secretion pathway protein A
MSFTGHRSMKKPCAVYYTQSKIAKGSLCLPAKWVAVRRQSQKHSIITSAGINFSFRHQFQTISNPALQPTDLIKAIILKLGDTSSDNGSKTILLDRLQKILFQNAEQGINTVLAIDEAHVISNQATLDELRMLLNIQTEDEFLITLVLLGQPPLLKNISELQPLKERISIKFNLEPLDIENALRYVVFRLKTAGASRGIFTREAIETLYDFSGGIPLRINNVCDRCLLIGLMQKADVVDSKIVEDAIEDLDS